MFRKPSLDSRRTAWIGEVTLVRPLSFSIYCALVGTFLVGFLFVVLFGSYTERASLTGALMPPEARCSDSFDPWRCARFEAAPAVALALRPGDQLDLKYPGYPSNLVGPITGVVSSIVPARQRTVNHTTRNDQAVEAGTAFIILVEIRSPSPKPHGRDLALPPGTEVRARILLERSPLLRKFSIS